MERPKRTPTELIAERIAISRILQREKEARERKNPPEKEPTPEQIHAMKYLQLLKRQAKEWYEKKYTQTEPENLTGTK